MGFGKAFEMIKENTKLSMRLPQWGEDVKIKVEIPNEKSKMSAKYLYVESRFGCVPWKENMIELFDEKWEVVE